MSSIVLAGVEGGLTSGASVVRRLVVKSAVVVANNIVEIKTGKDGNWEHAVETNLKNIYKNVAIDVAMDALGGKIGAAAGDKASKLIKINSGEIAKNIKKILHSVNVHVTGSLNRNIKHTAKNIKNVAPKVNNQFQESLKNAFKASTKTKIDIFKEQTNEKK